MQVLAIVGEPGIGKTRLLAELRVMASERGCAVVHAVASEFEAYVPYAITVAALDPYLSSLRSEAGDEDRTVSDLELGPIFPSLPGGSDETVAISASERWRIHRSIRELIERIAAETPLVIVLDDVHWGDAASIELIEALLRRPPNASALLALGFRDGQAPGRLIGAIGTGPVERIELEPLGRSEAAALLGVAADSSSFGSIYEQVNGNPFYLEQLARHGDPGGVPAVVTATVSAEVAALDAEARSLLEGAAVAGEPFEPDLAATVAELAEGDALRALDALLAADLIRPTDAPRRFAFRHPIVRRAVYEATPAGWTLAAHGRAATALESRGAPAAAIAPHVEFSASLGDEDAITLLLRAGDESSGRSPATAARCYGAGLRLIPADDRDRRIDVNRRLASSLRAAGDLEQAREALLTAIGLIDDQTDPRLAELTIRCAAIERWLGRGDDSRGRLESAASRLGEDEESTVGIRIELAVGAVYERDFEAAVRIGAEALAAARRTGEPATIGAAAAALCLAEAVTGRIAPAREHRGEALAVVDGLADDDLLEQVDSLYHLAWAENYLEQYEAALAHVDRMIGVVRRLDGARPLVPMMLLRCYPLETLGRLDEAAAVAEDALEASQLGGDSHFRSWAYFEHAWAHYYLGELAVATASAEESMRLSERRIGGAGPSAGIGSAWVLACALIESGEHRRARELLRPLVGEDIDGAMPVERAFFWETLSLAELEGGDRELAADHVARAERDAAGLGLSLPKGVAQRCRAQLDLADSRVERAASGAAESIGHFAAIGARIEVAFSRHLLGRALAATGDREAAIEALREAERELDACGSRRERDSARRELRKLGARAEVRGPGATGDGVAALTKREREVADLVVRRLTNREIAEELVLSEKTIESHLRNVFAKLGASSRVEVARTLEDLGTEPTSGAGGNRPPTLPRGD